MSAYRVLQPGETATSVALFAIARASRSLRCAHRKWFDIFPNIDAAKQVSAPVFVIHGTEDQEIPIQHGIVRVHLHLRRVADVHKRSSAGFG